MATIQLTFYIYLTDAAAVATYQGLYPSGVPRGPLPAATEFGAPFIAEGAAITYPCTRTGWMPPGASGKFPLDRAFFTINDGWFGHLFGRDQKYVWIGQFVYQPAATAGVPGEATPGVLRTLAWAQGFEHFGVTSIGGAEGESGTNFTLNLSRDASRTPDGMGFACRGAGVVTHAWSQFQTAPTTGRGWERFYIRIRALPDSDRSIWLTRADPPAEQVGITLMVNSTGAIVLRMVSNAGALDAVIGTAPAPNLNEWQLIDVFWTFGDADTGVEPSGESVHCVAEVWINHELAISGTGQRATNVVDPSVYTMNLSQMGHVALGTGVGMEIDFDDWLAFILPASDAIHPPVNPSWTAAIRRGVDWTHGHHVAYLEPRAFDATHSANWVGDVRTLTQRMGGTQAEDALTSSTSGALAAVTTLANLVGSADGVIGIQGLLVSALFRRAVGGNPSVGFTLNGTTTVMTAFTANTSNEWDWVLYAPAGLTAPLALTSLLLRFTKAADANLTVIAAMFAEVVLLGTFDNCDRYPDATGDPGPDRTSLATRGIHNAPYPRSIWNRSEVPPDSPVWVKAGTYTGNSLGQDVIAKIPAHFWFVRRTDSTTGAVRWWSSMQAAAWGLVGDQRGGVNVAEIDPEFVADGSDAGLESRSLIRIGGANAAHNLTGATYQYLAVGDPGMRFMLNGAFMHASATVLKVNALADPDFLAEFGFFLAQYALTGGAMFTKGPAHAATGGGQNSGAVAEAANVATFAAGLLSSLAGLHPSGPSQQAYSLWRQRDGADYDAYGITEPVVWQAMSIVGDGAASRTLALPRVSGKRPLWAWAQPVSGVAAYMRDPSHLTNTSSLASAGSATITTGITAGGVDSITIGSTLNVNGVAINLFVIMAADATAGNGGWGTNGEVLYPPVPATGGQWIDGYTQDELDEFENPTVPEEEEPDSFDDGPDLVDDLADALCVPFTLRAVNLAFARIGISDKLTAASDLLTPTSTERSLAAEFFEHTLRFVLRDFPWAHATRYAALVLVDGNISDPVNADWVYTFRAPTGCLFVRRVIRPELGRKHDPKPPAYRMVVDDVGPLIYVTDDGVQFDSTDEPFIEIEYTVRPPCGSKAGGDQKFVSAFAYRLAFELAGPCGRDEKTIARMERGYLLEKNTASTTVQNEQQQPPPGDPDWIAGR